MHPSVRKPPRQIVVVPRTKEQAPDVPLRLPRHFCADCGQQHVKCWQCDHRLPILNVADGFHIGHCDTHGQIVFVCPCKPALTSDERAALASQPIDRPKQLTHIREQVGSVMELQRHDRRMRDLMRVGAACLLFGFVCGVLLMLAAAFIGRLSGG